MSEFSDHQSYQNYLAYKAYKKYKRKYKLTGGGLKCEKCHKSKFLYGRGVEPREYDDGRDALLCLSCWKIEAKRLDVVAKEAAKEAEMAAHDAERVEKMLSSH